MCQHRAELALKENYRAMRKLITRIVRLWQRIKSRFEFAFHPPGEIKHEVIEDWEPRYDFVRKRIDHYRNQLLRYRLYLEHLERNASRGLLLELLEGQGEVTAKPVLYLNSSEWMWDSQRLQEAVTKALRDLELPESEESDNPTDRARQGCDRWAATEAKRLFDEKLGKGRR